MSNDATKGQSCKEHAATGEFHRKLDVFIGEVGQEVKSMEIVYTRA